MSRLLWFALGSAATYYWLVVRPKQQAKPTALEGVVPWASLYPEGSPRECYAIAKSAGGRQCFDRCKQTYAPPMYCIED